MDPLQFAYKAKRGVEDATLTHMELITHHLYQTGAFIKLLMVDFSSAFNTLQTHLLLSRLLDLDGSPNIVLWVRAFLRDRPQTVCVHSVKSKELIFNTGAPQGSVLSPILFSICTNEIMSNTTTLTLIKFADDMALVARLKDEDKIDKIRYKMNLYSPQREICLGQRFITKIFDRYFIHSHMYILTKVIQVKHFYMIL